MSIQQAVSELRARGFMVCRIKPGEKLPGYAGWSTRTLEAGAFAEGDNVGIVCGPINAARSLVCVDLDAPEAIRTADAMLPPTGMIDGRPGKPRSHRWYLVRNDTIPAAMRSKAEQAAPAAVQRCGHPGPRTLHGLKMPDGTAAIDVQGTGALAVVPPSVHASGVLREWEGSGIGEPAELDYPVLLDAVCNLARSIGATVPSFAVGDEPQPAGQQPAQNQDDAEQRYAAALEAAIHSDGLPRSGKGGDSTTFQLLAYGLHDFGLEPERVLSVFCRIINEPLKALNDAWTDTELRHKLESLIRRGPNAPKLPPMRWDDARRLAGTLPGAELIRYIGDTAWSFTGNRYAELPPVAVRNAMRRTRRSPRRGITSMRAGVTRNRWMPRRSELRS